MTAVGELAGAGVKPGAPMGLVVIPGKGFAVAWPGGGRRFAAADPVSVVGDLAELDPRWTWWSARETAPALVDAGIRPRACWDLGAVGALLHGLRRDDQAAVWAAAHGLPEPPARSGELDLFEVAAAGSGPLRDDGQLSAEWVTGGWAESLETAQRWAELAIDLQQLQAEQLEALPDPRALVTGRPLSILTAHAESAAALLCVELEHDGLPIDIDVAAGLLRATIGERPTDPESEAARRRERDAEVLRHFPDGTEVDLRSPEQVKALLARLGFDLPDTRSWRLEPHAATSEGVAALLAWRKADRVATTYGWRWLDTHVGDDGRLRGPWGFADGGAGRMTAGAGLHNLPAELRPAVRAAPGHLLVGADLGQVEPRVLAAVSGDPALASAAREADMYAPVAAQLQCDRPTAKVAVLAAMYGQTSGAAGAALRDMDRIYPQAMAYLRTAESVGRDRGALRTYGGRLIRFGSGIGDGVSGEVGGWSGDPIPDEDGAVTAARGRYARNACIQGPAAELFKAWAATVRAGLAAIRGQIVLCLHDELLLHVRQESVGAAAVLLTDSLETTVRWWAAGSDVRFVADIGHGPSWTDTH